MMRRAMTERIALRAQVQALAGNVDKPHEGEDPLGIWSHAYVGRLEPREARGARGGSRRTLVARSLRK